jgi:signal transduction histidine kinase
MRNSLGSIVGVLQVLNKKGGPFTEADEELLSALGGQAAMSIENSMLYHSVVDKNFELIDAQEELQQRTYELNVLYEIEKLISAELELDELLERVLHRSMDLVGAESGAIVLREPDEEQLVFRTCAGPIGEELSRRVIRIGEGIVGWTVARGEAVIVNEPVNDRRYNIELADELGLVPRHLACAPMVGDEVLGAIELVDKRDGDAGGDDEGFSETDLRLLELIAGQTSKAIQLARSRTERANEDRLATIGGMLAGVLHDLKTPMTIISGYAQLMAQMDTREEREEYVEQILRQFDLMSQMTREILAFARGQSAILIRKVYLSKFMEQLTKQLRILFADGDIELELDGDVDGVAYFDQSKVLRILLNLARNAAEAMPDGGVFRVTTRNTPDHLELEVADNGGGISPEIEERLFDLFSTGREGGTGLGLAIAKSFVDQHEGQISYRTELGVGTTFTVKLPNAGPQSGREAGSKRPHGPP